MEWDSVQYNERKIKTCIRFTKTSPLVLLPCIDFLGCPENSQPHESCHMLQPRTNEACNTNTLRLFLAHLVCMEARMIFFDFS